MSLEYPYIRTIKIWLIFFSNGWLYSYAGNTEISERWQVLKEDTSKNKYNSFYCKLENSSYFYFSFCVA